MVRCQVRLKGIAIQQPGAMICLPGPNQPPWEAQPAAMRRPFLLFVTISVITFTLFALAQTQSSPAAEPHFDGKIWWNYVWVLAADDMEGRETGSTGLRKAQDYVVEQLKSAGLEPAGMKGYFQPIQLVSRQIVEKESSLTL